MAILLAKKLERNRLLKMKVASVPLFFWDILLATIWLAMQLIFSLYIYTSIIAQRVVCWALGLRYITTQSKKRALDKMKEKLGLVPKHFSLIVDSKKASIPLVADTILWCEECGIRYVTIYDMEGIIKSEAEQLGKLCIERKIRDSTLNIEIRTFANAQEEPFRFMHGEKRLNKGDEQYDIIVNLISFEDAVNDLMHTTKRYCWTTANDPSFEESNGKVLTVNALINNLAINSGQPDPDLLVKCGSLFTLDGYPPMLLRLTEISHSPNFGFAEFCSILRKYSHVIQREGK